MYAQDRCPCSLGSLSLIMSRCRPSSRRHISHSCMRLKDMGIATPSSKELEASKCSAIVKLEEEAPCRDNTDYSSCKETGTYRQLIIACMLGNTSVTMLVIGLLVFALSSAIANQRLFQLPTFK